MAQKGRILVRVTLSEAKIPLIGAHISIVGEKSGKTVLYKTFFTDENGKTPITEFDVPNEETSQNDINAEEKFFVCNIIATHSDCYTTYIKNIQLFANQTAIQEINALPLKEDADPAGVYRIIEITPQNL